MELLFLAQRLIHHVPSQNRCWQVLRKKVVDTCFLQRLHFKLRTGRGCCCCVARLLLDATLIVLACGPILDWFRTITVLPSIPITLLSRPVNPLTSSLWFVLCDSYGRNNNGVRRQWRFLTTMEAPLRSLNFALAGWRQQENERGGAKGSRSRSNGKFHLAGPLCRCAGPRGNLLHDSKAR